MVSINKVYTTVQALLNKEQRGYLVPSSFNRFGEQAQLKLFEAYFYDLPHFGINNKSQASREGYASVEDNLEERINVFSQTSSITPAEGVAAYPTDFYRMTALRYNNIEVEEIPKKDLSYVLGSLKMCPKESSPKYVERGNGINIYPTTITTLELDYIKRPSIPRWAYFSPGSSNIFDTYPELDTLAIPDQPLFNPNNSTDFELHPSEQYKLVEKILQLAGLEIREADIVQFANNEMVQGEQIQKS